MKIDKRGFTLFEVLTTIIIFVVVIIALIEVFNAGVLGSGDVENMRIASSIAQARMEAIRSASFASVVSSSAAPDANFPNFSVAVTVAPSPTADPKTVTVKVTWTHGGSDVDITLTTLRARYSDA